MGKVAIGGDISEGFDIKHGVKQGCGLAPTLFTLYLAAVLETMGSMFNLTRLKACTKTREVCIRELLCADDSAFVALEQENMQEIVDRFSAAATDFGLKINVAKTELLYQPPFDGKTAEDAQPSILVNGVALKTIESFTYHGSTVTATNSLDLEVIEGSKEAATKAYGALYKHLWSRQDIRLSTKIKVDNVAVLC